MSLFKETTPDVVLQQSQDKTRTFLKNESYEYENQGSCKRAADEQLQGASKVKFRESDLSRRPLPN